MTVETLINKIECLGDGETKEFALPFKIYRDYHVKAIIKKAGYPQEQFTAFEIEGVGQDSGCRAITYEPLEKGTKIIFYRELPIVQEDNYRENDGFLAETLEKGTDRAVMILQQINEKTSRSLTLGMFDTESDPDKILPKIFDAEANSILQANKAKKSADEAEESNQSAKEQAKRAETEANRAEASAELAKGVDLGTVLASVKTVVPVGALWCDGSEWVQAQFPDFYGKLVDGEIKSTDYSTFNNAIQTCGWCGVCAVDTVNKKFKTAKITNNAQIGIIPNEDNKNLGRFLVEEKSFSAPYGGYEIYSDGFMIQWRKDPFPSGVNSTNGNTITLYKPYKDATYNILGIASMNAAGIYPTGEGIISLRKEAFIFRVVSGANNANTQVRDYAWETRGYSDYAFLEDPKYYITIYNGAVQPSMAQAAEFVEKITALQNGIGFSTAGKEMFLEQEDLDYSRASAVTVTTTPTIIKKRGYLLGATYIGGATPQDLLINNVVVARETGEFCNIQMRVSAGDSVKVSANGSSNITFIPLKGAL